MSFSIIILPSAKTFETTDSKFKVFGFREVGLEVIIWIHEQKILSH